MAAGVLFYSFLEAQMEKKHDWENDTFKIMLTNTAPDAATNTVKADITEISAGNGYPAGGFTVVKDSSSQASGIFNFVPDGDITVTATGGAIATWRYAVLYNDTASGDPLIGYWDAGVGGISIPDGEFYKFIFGAFLARLAQA